MQPTLQGSGFGNFQAGKAGWIAFPGLVSVSVNLPCQTVTSVEESPTAKGVKTITCPPYPLDIIPADFFLFPSVKSELAGLLLSQDSFKTGWEGVMRTIAKDELATVFQQ
jgi:hypothetical protein